VLSVHTASVVVAAKIAAAHHADRLFLQLATAFGPIASIESHSPHRAFDPERTLHFRRNLLRANQFITVHRIGRAFEGESVAA
jgi:hypothetical protein